MGKHNTIVFKLQVLQPILKGEMSIQEAAPFTISGLKQRPRLWLSMDSTKIKRTESDTILSSALM